MEWPDLLATALGAYLLYTIARGSRPSAVAELMAYLAIIAILAPFMPHYLPSPWPIVSDYGVTSMGIGIAGLALGIANAIITAVTGDSIPWLGFMANTLLNLNGLAWYMLAIYTVGYLAWVWAAPAVMIGAVVALRSGRLGFGIAYTFIALSMVAGFLAPFVSILGALTIHAPRAIYFTVITGTPNNTLVVTDQGLGFTPTVLVTTGPVRVVATYWLWLRLNYTVVNATLPDYGFARVIGIRLEPALEPITCGGAPCGAYAINATPVAIEGFGNGTVELITNESLAIWLWGSGYSANCTATARNVTWLAPVDISNYTQYISQLPGSLVPSPAPLGYRQLAITINPGVGECLVRLYGVTGNVWRASTPIGWTPYVGQVLAEYRAIASLGTGREWARLLMGIYALASVGAFGVITWDYWLALIRRLLD